LLRRGYLGALEDAAHHRCIKSGPRRGETHVVVPPLSQGSYRVGGLHRRFLACEKLRERRCHGGTQQAISAAVVVVEGGGSDMCQCANSPRRELSLALILENLQSGSEQGGACIHNSNIALLY
jgi:hypothetical protein